MLKRVFSIFKTIWHDIPLAWQLLRREGLVSFIKRIYLYVFRRQRLLPPPVIKVIPGILPDRSPEEIAQGLASLTYLPTISIITPVYNVDPHWLNLCLESVLKQTYPHWELCLCDDASTRPETKTCLQAWMNKDARLKIFFSPQNQGIAGASNKCLEQATGDFIALLDNDDTLAPEALWKVAEALNEDRLLDWIYTDEDKVKLNKKGEEEFFDYYFKPDWDPHFLFNSMYTGHLTVYRTTRVRELGGFRSEFNFSQDYDLALRMAETTDRIKHLPYILYHWRHIPTSAAAGGKNFARESNLAALRSACQRRGYDAEVLEYPFANRVKFRLKNTPLVSIIIPSDNLANIRHGVDLLLKHTAYPHYEVVVVTNSQIVDQLATLYHDQPAVRGCRYDLPFNFSDKCNQGAAMAQGEYYLFLNDDIEITQPDWIEGLLQIFEKGNVGGVSPKLFYENNTIQYAGMVTGVRGFFGTAFHTAPKDSSQYFNLILSERNTSQLSGACLLLPKHVFSEIGGFDSVHTPIMHSDIDLCFKIKERGYEMIYTPFVELCHIGHLSIKHSEKKAIKKDTVDLYVLKRWGNRLGYDPYYPDNMRDYLHHDGAYPYRLVAMYQSDPRYFTSKNILLITHELSLTGAPLILYYLAEYLHQQGIFVTLMSPVDGPLRSKFTDLDIPVIIDATIISTPLTETKKTIKNYDLVLVNTLTMYAAVNAAQEVQVPTLYFIHESKFGTKMIVDQPLIKTALHNADRLLFIGQENSQLYAEYERPTTVLNYGTLAISGTAHPHSDAPIKILHVGSIEPRKGQDVLVNAFLCLPSDYQSKIEISFVGRTLNQEYYQNLIKRTATYGQIQWRGELSRDQITQAYLDTDIFVCTSRDEVGPITVLEAMSCARAIVATKVGGVATMLTDHENGFIVENEDYQTIAQRLQTLINQSDTRKELGEKAAQKYRQQFTMEQMNESIYQVIKSII